MADREKVIADLEFSYNTTLSGYAMQNYGRGIHGVTGETLRDALVLLKAQEPVEPSWRLGIPFCGKCGRQFGRGFKYCPDCGRAVKWE